jgi:hypothetical protein
MWGSVAGRTMTILMGGYLLGCRQIFHCHLAVLHV